LCDEVGLQPTVFYRWQKEFFENGAAAFEQKRRTNDSANQERIAYLQKKIQTKDEVLAELMAEHVALKKTLGNSDRELGSARYAESDRGFRPALVGEDRDWRRAVHPMARHHCQQVLRLPAIIGFHLKNPLEGYRRLTFMMLDANIVAVSPTSVWRVLGQAAFWTAAAATSSTGICGCR
jgi:transposase-like protein